MSAGKEKGCWIQCQQCGHVFWLDQEVPIEKLYVASVCPGCGSYGNGLNCGDDGDDIYLYMSENVDPRYYQY